MGAPVGNLYLGQEMDAVPIKAGWLDQFETEASWYTLRELDSDTVVELHCSRMH